MTTKVKEIIQDCQAKIKAEYGTDVPTPKVIFNSRITRTLGRASVGREPLIELSSKRFVGKTDTKAFEDTVRHEFAHIAEYYLYGNMDGHNYRWRGIARTVGAVPSPVATTEQMKEMNVVPKRKMQKFSYQCECGSHEVSARNHNKILAGARFLCSRCKTPIKPL